MCDVALSMWLLFSLFSLFGTKNEDESRESENTENEIAWELIETVKTSWKALFHVLNFIEFQHYATLSGENQKNEFFAWRSLFGSWSPSL